MHAVNEMIRPFMARNHGLDDLGVLVSCRKIDMSRLMKLFCLPTARRIHAVCGALLVLCFGVAAHADPVNLKMTVVLASPLTESADRPLSVEFRLLALPTFEQAICPQFSVLPEIRIERVDLQQPAVTALPQYPADNSLAAGWSAQIDQILRSKAWASPSEKTVDLEALATEAVVAQAGLRFIYPARPDDVDENRVREIFSAFPPGSTHLVGKNQWRSQLIAALCAASPEQSRQNALRTHVVLLFKPPVALSLSNPQQRPNSQMMPGQCALPRNIEEGDRKSVV